MERILEESDEGVGVPCSICLDLVINGGERSCAKLQCGHQFHLDCIGSAFNMKGMMQCPNCRKIEKGRWLIGSGSTNLSPEISMDDGSTDALPFYFSYTEMPYRVQICPFRGLPQVHTSSESTLGMMSTMAPMVNHQHHGISSPHSHGWLHFHHAPFQPHHPLAPALPLPVANTPMRFDTQRSLPRFIPPRRVYEPSNSFSPYGEIPAMNYSHSWVRDHHPHFPLP